MKALVTGGTGFVGPRLLRLLDQPVVVSRNPERARRSVGHLAGRIIRWDPLEGPPPPEAFADVDVIYHLAGESVAEGRWTAAQKARIRDSRVIGTRHLVQGIAQAAHKPRVLVSASAVGFYGDRGDEILTEMSRTGDGFLADVGTAWEAATAPAAEAGIRVVRLRFGIVLDPAGGALERMLQARPDDPRLRFGLALEYEKAGRRGGGSGGASVPPDPLPALASGGPSGLDR
jgi:uncharacterized protein (TIGR01777 family)